MLGPRHLAEAEASHKHKEGKKRMGLRMGGRNRPYGNKVRLRSFCVPSERGGSHGQDTGEGHRDGLVDDRTQVENPKTDQYVKRNRNSDRGVPANSWT